MMPTKLLEITWGVSMIHHNQSNYAGNPSFSIPDGYLKAALDLLILGVDRLKKRNCVEQIYESQRGRKNKTIEDTITRELAIEMQKEHERYKLRIDSQTQNFIHPCNDIEYSVIDIRFTWNIYTNEYLAAEAKLLYGKGASLAGPYVEKGVMDFIGGKYSMGHSHGIMLGYILLKPIDNAITSVKKVLEKRRTKTNEISPIDKVQGFNYSQMYRSAHTQKVTGEKIIIYHMFVDLAS